MKPIMMKLQFLMLILRIKRSEDVYLEPYDIVIVKSMPGYIRQRSVLVLGEIKSPGRYSLEKSGDRISDILKKNRWL